MDASNVSQASVRLAEISLAFLGGWVGDPGKSRMLSPKFAQKRCRDSLAAGDTNRQPVQLTGGGGHFRTEQVDKKCTGLAGNSHIFAYRHIISQHRPDSRF